MPRIEALYREKERVGCRIAGRKWEIRELYASSKWLSQAEKREGNNWWQVRCDYSPVAIHSVDRGERSLQVAETQVKATNNIGLSDW